jgi:CheY-like chemotaxis protein
VIEETPLVLIVDDVAETRRLMRRVLERDRFRVNEAASGEDALRIIRSSRPQLVILDLRLPQMSGFDVARELRSYEDPGLAGIPLIACSASVQPEVRDEALEPVATRSKASRSTSGPLPHESARSSRRSANARAILCPQRSASSGPGPGARVVVSVGTIQSAGVGWRHPAERGGW